MVESCPATRGVVKIPWFLRFGRCVALAYFSLALLAVAFLAPRLPYACKGEEASLSLPSLAVVVIVGLVVSVALAKRRPKANVDFLGLQMFRRVSISLAVVVFVLQICLINSIYFETGWDVGVLMSRLSDEGATLDYFSRYPNQLFLLFIFKTVGHFCQLIGFQNVYLMLDVVGAACVTLAVVLTSFVVARLAGFGPGYYTLAFGCLYLSFSPWIAVPYSDTYGTICPALVLFLYNNTGRSPLRTFGMLFFGVVGYFIKPTAIFVVVSIVLIEAACAISRRRFVVDGQLDCSQIKSLFFQFAAITCALVLSFGANSLAREAGPVIDADKSFSMAHFLMMGFNDETYGCYYEDDVIYSASFGSQQDRSHANFEKWAERLESLGPQGVLKLMVQKTISNYSDGTFAWAAEGNFFLSTPHSDNTLSKFFGEDGSFTLFQVFAQLCWMFVLVGMCLNWLKFPRSKTEYVVLCSVFLLSVFLMLFECRARYLFLYSPFFIALAVLGWRNLIDVFAKRFSENRLSGRERLRGV